MYHHRIWYFPAMGGVNRGVGVGGVGLHVSKERGDLNKGGDEERKGWLIHLSALWYL